MSSSREMTFEYFSLVEKPFFFSIHSYLAMLEFIYVNTNKTRIDLRTNETVKLWEIGQISSQVYLSRY
jgi:hypothetical protein